MHSLRSPMIRSLSFLPSFLRSTPKEHESRFAENASAAEKGIIMSIMRLTLARAALFSCTFPRFPTIFFFPLASPSLFFSLSSFAVERISRSISSGAKSAIEKDRSPRSLPGGIARLLLLLYNSAREREILGEIPPPSTP